LSRGSYIEACVRVDRRENALDSIINLRTLFQRAIWLRIGGAGALLGYSVLLFFAHVHVALESHAHHHTIHAHHHHSVASPVDHHHEYAGPDHDQHEPEPSHHGADHKPHPVGDHNLEESTAVLRIDALLVHDFTPLAVLVTASDDPALPGVFWTHDPPKHPPPRRPEQPRSPPLV
jgi:hypothetical protein